MTTAICERQEWQQVATTCWYCGEFLYTVQGVQTGKWENRLYYDLVFLGMANLALSAAFYLLVLFLHMYAHRYYLRHPRS